MGPAEPDGGRRGPEPAEPVTEPAAEPSSREPGSPREPPLERFGAPGSDPGPACFMASRDNLAADLRKGQRETTK